MVVRTKVEPIERDIQLLISQDLSPAAQSKVFADYARQQIDDARVQNRKVLGREPRMTLTVDGREGGRLESVKPNGVVKAEFHLINDVLMWIRDQLERHSPVKSGRYRKSHALTADGTEVADGQNIPPASEYVFINLQPYARKIERGQSSQAPDGVYQAVATLAKRFGNQAKISFGYRTPMFGAVHGWAQTASAKRHAAMHGRRSDAGEWLRRQPAIIVSLR